MCDFKPGDEVVCVDDRSVLDVGFSPISPLTKGAVYVVKDTYIRTLTGRVCLRLVNHPNDRAGNGDIGFAALRFRKVHRKTTDLSVESFLTIKPGFEEPRRTKQPAPKVDA